MQLFIDTNVFLNFYHYTGDDIDIVTELLDLLQGGRIFLHMPQQVEDEFFRNREGKLRATALEFNRDSFPEQIPRHMSDMEMAAAYKQAVLAAKRARGALVAEATAKALTGSLEVDKALKSIFDNATKYPHDDEILARGKSRADRGNPPGKVGSYGDQYNWEILLQNLPDDDLYIVSKDGDYASSLGGKDDNGFLRPNPFLKSEWAQRKNNGNLYIFDSIKAVLANYKRVVAENAAPEAVDGDMAGRPVEAHEVADEREVAAGVEPIEVDAHDEGDAEVQDADINRDGQNAGVPNDEPQADAELDEGEREAKNQAVEELVHSRNFASTHSAISSLIRFEPFFTKADADRMAEAAHSNQQIGWIIGDDDVNGFYLRLLQNHISELDPINVDILIDLLDLLPDQYSEGEEAVEF